MAEHLPLWRSGEAERLAFWLRHLPDGAWLVAFRDDPATPVKMIEARLQATTDLSLYSFNLGATPDLLLAALPSLSTGGRVVISCTGLAGQPVWPSLDRLRQVWPEYPYLLLLWLTLDERDLLIRHRPSIWATSGAYFDFLIPAPAGAADPRPLPRLYFEDRTDWKTQVRTRQKWLEELHTGGQAPPAVLSDLYNQLIRLYYAVGEHRQGKIIARAHLVEAEQLNYLPGQASALADLGTAAWKQGNRQAARIFYEQALALWQQLNAPAGEALTLGNLGRLRMFQSDWAAAEIMLQQALGRYRQVGDRSGEAAILNGLGELHQRSGDQARALALFQRALGIRQEVEDRPGEARTLGNIGSIYQARQNLDRAQEVLSRALTIQQKLDNRAGEAHLLLNLAALAAQLQQPLHALSHYRRALWLWQELGYRRKEAATLEKLALVQETMGDRESALAMYNQAAAIRQELGS